MTTMVWFLNLYYYFLYRLEYRIHLFLVGISPLAWFVKHSSLSKKKPNFREELDEAYKNPRHGMSIINAMWPFVLVFFCFWMGVIVLMFSAMRLKINLLALFITNLLLTMLLNYVFIERNRRHLTYFSEFDAMPRDKKIFWALICVVFSIGCVCFGFYCAMHFEALRW